MENTLKEKKVSRDSFGKYEELLKKWQKTINLVSPKTLSNLWERHFADSLYLYDFIKDKDLIIDIGSGAGFPAMVLAIVGSNEKNFPKIVMIEADERKCFFLQEIKRAYNLKDTQVEIKNIRVENLNKDIEEKGNSDYEQKAKYITGRAFAPLDKFLDLCKTIIDSNTEMYLLKGDNIQEEIKEAKNHWDFQTSIYKKDNGTVTKVWDIKKNRTTDRSI